MIALITNLKIVLISLVVLNTLLLLIFRSELKYVKAPLTLFIILLLVSLGYRFLAFSSINQQIEKEKQSEIKKRGWEYLKVPDLDAAFLKRQHQNSLVNATLFRIAGLQAVFAFILAAIGVFITPIKKVYGLYALGFLILAFLFFR